MDIANFENRIYAVRKSDETRDLSDDAFIIIAENNGNVWSSKEKFFSDTKDGKINFEEYDVRTMLIATSYIPDAYTIHKDTFIPCLENMHNAIYRHVEKENGYTRVYGTSAMIVSNTEEREYQERNVLALATSGESLYALVDVHNDNISYFLDEDAKDLLITMELGYEYKGMKWVLVDKDSEDVCYPQTIISIASNLS